MCSSSLSICVFKLFKTLWYSADNSRVRCVEFRARNLRVSLNETPEFPFWVLHICVDFDLSDSTKMETIKKLNEITKILLFLLEKDMEKIVRINSF